MASISYPTISSNKPGKNKIKSGKTRKVYHGVPAFWIQLTSESSDQFPVYSAVYSFTQSTVFSKVHSTVHSTVYTTVYITLYSTV